MSAVAPIDPAERSQLPVGVAPSEARGGRGTVVLRGLLHDRTALAALTILGLLVLGALLGPIVLRDPTQLEPANRFADPTLTHPFGTDELGRDLFSRVMDAGRLSLGIAAASTAMAMVVGTAWGFVAAVSRGFLDEALMRLVDAAMAIPMILFALIFVAALGTDGETLALIIGLLMIPLTARVARAAVLTELAMDYHRALVAVGVPRWRIMIGEVMPNAAPPLLAQASLNLATSLMVEASLSFVGLGVQPPDASWGTLLQVGYQNLFNTIWYPLFPALAIAATVGALNVVADRVQAILDRTDA
jgi:ABC-type dipeptide/oligopeptide/nickel transport system permease subunit